MKQILLGMCMLGLFNLEGSEYDMFIVDQSGNKRDIKEAQDMSQYVSSNLSRKSVTNNIHECSEAIVFKKTDKSLVITSDQFGPLPARLILKDKNGKEIYSQVNKNDPVTIFEISGTVLSSSNIMEVRNAFNDRLMCNPVEKQ